MYMYVYIHMNAYIYTHTHHFNTLTLTDNFRVSRLSVVALAAIGACLAQAGRATRGWCLGGLGVW